MEAGSLRSGCWHPQVMGLFWVADFPPYPYLVEGARESSGAFLIKALIPFMGFPGGSAVKESTCNAGKNTGVGCHGP